MSTNNETHVEWFKKSAETGNCSGMAFYSYKLLLKDDEPSSGISHIWAQKVLASLDSFAIGFCHFNGLATPKNEEKALKYFEISAKEGNEYGAHYMGNCFYDGHGTQQSTVKAVFWYLKAAEQGILPSQCYVANLYVNGVGCERNKAVSKYWQKKAYNNNQACEQFFFW